MAKLIMGRISGTIFNPFAGGASEGLVEMMVSLMYFEPETPEETAQREREHAATEAAWKEWRYGMLPLDTFRIIEGHTWNSDTYILERRPPTLANGLRDLLVELYRHVTESNANRILREAEEDAKRDLPVPNGLDSFQQYEAAETAARAILEVENPGLGERASFRFVWNGRL